MNRKDKCTRTKTRALTLQHGMCGIEPSWKSDAHADILMDALEGWRVCHGAKVCRLDA